MANICFLVPVLLLAVLVQDGVCLKCYSCSSDMTQLCQDPFTAEAKRTLSMVECPSNPPPDIPDTYKAYCKTQTQNINGEIITSRTCTWKGSQEGCPFTKNLLTCEFCNDSDGCNGNGAATVEKTAALVAVSLAILFYFK